MWEVLLSSFCKQQKRGAAILVRVLQPGRIHVLLTLSRESFFPLLS